MFKNYKEKIIRFISKNRDPIFFAVIIHLFLFVILDQMEITFIPKKKDKIIDIVFPEDDFKKEEEKSQKNDDIEEEYSQEKYRKSLEKQMTNRIASLDKFTKDISSQYKDISNNDQSLKEARKMEDIFSDNANNRDPYGNTEDKENDFYSDVKNTTLFTGKSNISYTLKGRHAIKTYNPIYKCPKGGYIVIDIEVNGSGEVIDVRYNKIKSTSGDKCLVDTAIEYAQRFIFNADYRQPSQKGEIMFNFL